MPTFLVRDLSNPRGYAEVSPPGGSLPRSREESYVPWALLDQKRVVYARTGQHTSWRGGPGLTPYDTQTSQRRRRLCESALGMAALRNPSFTDAATRAVSSSVKRYLLRHFFTSADSTRKVVFKEIGHYFFTDGGMGFGRISEAKKDTVGVVSVWTGILDALGGDRLDQIMAIHDAVGRKVLPVLGGPEKGTYDSLGPTVRRDWFDDVARRGRANAGRPVATTSGGTAQGSDGGALPGTVQARNRGVDMFRRDPTRMRDGEGDAYYDDLDARNLLFGAGISGTTGSLLQAGFAFGKLGGGELLKQYTLAIVGYLVGGGMHSFHESLAVAQRVGVPYEPGLFLPSLPSTLTRSAWCASWRDEYHDVVVLGALHWRNNAGALPSHLNSNLRSPL